MLGEQLDGTITEIESRDVVFLEREIPVKGDIYNIDRFFEVDESQESTPNSDKEDESDLLQMRVTYCLVRMYLRVERYH